MGRVPRQPAWARRKAGRAHSAPVGQGELTNAQFVRVLRRLPDATPVAQAFEKCHGQTRGVWYRTQQEHMLGWFRSQETRGAGSYSRSAPNSIARVTYNRLQCAEALLWIGEALGADVSLVMAAAEHAAGEDDHRRRCGIIRRHLPWDTVIEPLALDRVKDLR